MSRSTTYKIRYTTPILSKNAEPEKRFATEFVHLPNVRALLHYLNKFVERARPMQARITSVWVSNGKMEDVAIVHLFAKELETQKFIPSYKERLLFAAQQKMAVAKTERKWKARDRVTEFMIEYAMQTNEDPTIENLTSREPRRSVIHYRIQGGKTVMKLPCHMSLTYNGAVDIINELFEDVEVLQVTYTY